MSCSCNFIVCVGFAGCHRLHACFTADVGADAEASRASAECAAVAVLTVAMQLADARLLLGSPQAAALLAVPPPGAPADAQRPSAEDMVKRVQVSTVLQFI